MTDIVLDTDLTTEQRECLEIAKFSADSLLGIINDILDLSKIEAGKLELDTLEFNLAEHVEEIVRTLSFSAQKKGLEIVCDLDRHLPELVHGDPTRLRQVIVNLIGNAIKFTEKGAVVISVSRQSTAKGRVTLLFTIADTGLGIAPEKQQLIFEAFSQAEASTSRKFGGTGLGLTISSQIVSMMNGRIWVESEGLGKGSRFRFTANLGFAEAKDEARASSGQQTRPVLIVDDNELSARALKNLAEHLGFRPTVTSNGTEALAELRRQSQTGLPYSLALLDAEMPDVDPFGMAVKMRQEPELATQVALLFPSNASQADRTRCRDLGVGFLLKPPRRQEVLAFFENIGKTPGQSSENRGGSLLVPVDKG
jgi:CheY-like chemotaxis protein